MSDLRAVYAEASAWREADGTTRPVVRIYCAGKYLAAIEPDHAERLAGQLERAAQTIRNQEN